MQEYEHKIMTRFKTSIPGGQGLFQRSLHSKHVLSHTRSVFGNYIFELPLETLLVLSTTLNSNTIILWMIFENNKRHSAPSQVDKVSTKLQIPL